MRKKEVGIKDIADYTGVSIATVSRALRGQNNVRPATYQKIMNAASALGYDSNLIPPASSAKQILVVHSPASFKSYKYDIINGIQSSAKQHSFNLILAFDKDYTYDTLLELAKETNSLGLIFINSPISFENFDKLILQTNSVLCSDSSDNPNCSFVAIDDQTAAKTAVTHLISLGRKKIAFLSPPFATSKYSRDRFFGFSAAMNAAGLQVNDDWVLQISQNNMDIFNSILMQFFSRESRPDALFTISDEYAIIALNAAVRLGLRVPDDLAIVGFNNDFLSSISTPTITTINQPYFRMGYLAMEILAEKIVSPHCPPKRIFLETELVVRESTTPSV